MTGQVEVDDTIAAIRPTTCLVSIMLANNETGVIMVSWSLGFIYHGLERRGIKSVLHTLFNICYFGIFCALRCFSCLVF